MIRYPPTLLDDRADSGQRPPLGLEAGPLRPTGEDLEQLLPLRGSQPRGASRLGMAPQGRKPSRAVAELLRPLADGRGADTEPPSDLGLRETAGAKQAASCEPALFELFGSELAWSPHPYESNARASSC